MGDRSISPYEKFGEINPDTDANAIVHVFDASETITGIAHRYYGDWTLWRLIADRNNISDPRQIEPGTQLVIPSRPLEKGELESF
jgi:nucleoid-associated protein YgaU